MAHITITVAEIGQVLTAAAAGNEAAMTNAVHSISTREDCSVEQVLIQIEDEEQKNVLHHAAEHGRANIIRMISGQLLAHEAATTQRLLGATSSTGDTPLMWAARYGSVNAMMELYLAGAQDLEIRNHFGSTALHIATSRGDVISMQALLDLGADPESRNIASKTALCLTARNDFLHAAQTLLSVQAELNPRDMYGRSPLHIAARYRHPLIVQLLLQAGADADARDNNG